jgi:uncharacterized membrane-anchored protein
MRLDLNRHFRAPKVPEIDGAFWIIKLLTTAMGEATSDYFVHHFNPELVVVTGGVVFLVALWWQLRAPRYLIGTYWIAVVMVAVFGTMCADVAHVGFGIPYVVSTSTFAVVLAAVFVSWHRVEHTLSIHSITTTRRELFYWATVLSTFALGTALGDMTANTLHLGYLTSGVLFTVAFCLPAIGYGIFGLNSVAMFWTAYVLTRPLGASFADYLGMPHSVGGRAWGPGNVALLFSALIVLGISYLLARYHRARRAARLTPRASRGTSPWIG